MSSKAKRVFSGWLELTPSEQLEFDQEVKKYTTSSSERKQTLKKGVRDSISLQTGPLGSNCPYCGR